MPVTVEKQGQLYRVVEVETGRLAETASGTPSDGGGHRSEQRAQAQANAINAIAEDDSSD